MRRSVREADRNRTVIQVLEMHQKDLVPITPSAGSLLWEVGAWPQEEQVTLTESRAKHDLSLQDSQSNIHHWILSKILGSESSWHPRVWVIS